MDRATDRSAQWLQSPRAYMPHGRDTRPRSQRRTESLVSVRSGIILGVGAEAPQGHVWYDAV
eukprot:476258-Pyramimonas_sp.AAC.1